MKHCQLCKAEWPELAPYCTECGFYASNGGQGLPSVSATTHTLNRQLSEKERESREAKELIQKAKNVVLRLLSDYEAAHSGHASWTDYNFEVNLSDAQKLLLELERAS